MTYCNLIKLGMVSTCPPSLLLESWNRDVLDGAGDGVRLLKIPQGSFAESFIKIQHQEACQDSTYPPSLFLESWRTGMFLMELAMVSGYS